MKEYLAILDDTSWGAASEVVPKFVSPSDPAAQWTGALKGPAFFAYSDNYLIDVKFSIIVDVEASRAIRQAEVSAAKTMIERTEERFGLKPERLVGDTAYGAAPMLNWLVEEKGIAPHIPGFDKSKRNDGTFSRSDFRYDPTSDVYHCRGGSSIAPGQAPRFHCHSVRCKLLAVRFPFMNPGNVQPNDGIGIRRAEPYGCLKILNAVVGGAREQMCPPLPKYVAALPGSNAKPRSKSFNASPYFSIARFTVALFDRAETSRGLSLIAVSRSARAPRTSWRKNLTIAPLTCASV